MTNSIIVKSHYFIRKERVAVGAFYPGHLVKLDSAGKALKHATAGGYAAKAFALENSPIGGDVADVYAIGQTAQIGIFHPGDEVYAWLAYGENVAKGDLLSSNGDGSLQKIAGSEVAIAVALEAVNNNSAGEDRIRVEVM